MKQKKRCMKTGQTGKPTNSACNNLNSAACDKLVQIQIPESNLTKHTNKIHEWPCS